MARIHLFSTSPSRDDVDSHLLLPPRYGRLYPLHPRLAAPLLDGDLEEYPPLTVASSLLPNWPQRHNIKGASSTDSTVCLGVMAPRQQLG